MICSVSAPRSCWRARSSCLDLLVEALERLLDRVELRARDALDLVLGEIEERRGRLLEGLRGERLERSRELLLRPAPGDDALAQDKPDGEAAQDHADDKSCDHHRAAERSAAVGRSRVRLRPDPAPSLSAQGVAGFALVVRVVVLGGRAPRRANDQSRRPRASRPAAGRSACRSRPSSGQAACRENPSCLLSQGSENRSIENGPKKSQIRRARRPTGSDSRETSGFAEASQAEKIATSDNFGALRSPQAGEHTFLRPRPAVRLHPWKRSSAPAAASRGARRLRAQGRAGHARGCGRGCAGRGRASARGGRAPAPARASRT